MSNALLDFLRLLVTPCGHQTQSWPMRLPGEKGAHRTCLECGRRQRYSLLDTENVPLLENAPNRFGNRDSGLGTRDPGNSRIPSPESRMPDSMLRRPRPIKLVAD